MLSDSHAMGVLGLRGSADYWNVPVRVFSHVVLSQAPRGAVALFGLPKG